MTFLCNDNYLTNLSNISSQISFSDEMSYTNDDHMLQCYDNPFSHGILDILNINLITEVDFEGEVRDEDLDEISQEEYDLLMIHADLASIINMFIGDPEGIYDCQTMLYDKGFEALATL